MKLFAVRENNFNVKYLKRKVRYSFSRNMQSHDDINIEINSILEQARSPIFTKENMNTNRNDNVNSFSANEKRTVIQTALDIMQEGLVERSEEVKLLLLAALCKEHLLLLGPPGTGINIALI